jgi:hypothetical protein
LAYGRQIFTETTRALLVLALVCFGFSAGMAESASQVGASPAVAASIARQLSASALCGGGWGDDHSGHAPCHACRSAPGLLPPPPGSPERIGFATAQVVFVPPVVIKTRRPHSGQAPARAPPLA